MTEPTEAGLRRAARRQGLVLSKARTRDRTDPAYGTYSLAPVGSPPDPAAVGAVIVGAVATFVTGEPMSFDDVAEALCEV